MVRPLVSTPSPPGFLRRHAVKLIASALITMGVVYMVHTGGLKLVPNVRDFAGVHWAGVAAYALTVLAMTWFRSVRWRFLLRGIAHVPKRRLLAISCAGFAAILLLPFRIGEIARPYMLRTRPEDRVAGQPAITMTTAMGSVVAERIIDGLFLSVVLATVLVVVPTVKPLPARVVGLPISVASVRGMGFAMLGLFAVAFATIAVFYFAREWARRVTHVVFGIVSQTLADKLADVATKLADGLHVFGRLREFSGFMVESAVYWGLNALGMWILGIACGIVHADGTSITFLEACTLMGMLGCTILIPGPPGLLGVFQAGIYAGMTFYFPTEIVTGPGSAYVFLMYATQLILTVICGAWGVWYQGGAQRLRGALEAPN